MKYLITAPDYKAEKVLELYNLKAFCPKTIETQTVSEDEEYNYAQWCLIMGIDGKGISIEIPDLTMISRISKTLNAPIILYPKGVNHVFNKYIPEDHEGVIVIYDSYIE